MIYYNYFIYFIYISFLRGYFSTCFHIQLGQKVPKTYMKYEIDFSENY